MINLIYVLTMIIETLLAFRVVFTLFQASASTSAVHLLYQASDPLVQPFQNIFHTVTLGSSYVLDWSTIVALIVYGLAGFLLGELIQVFMIRARNE